VRLPHDGNGRPDLVGAQWVEWMHAALIRARHWPDLSGQSLPRRLSHRRLLHLLDLTGQPEHDRPRGLVLLQVDQSSSKPRVSGCPRTRRLAEPPNRTKSGPPSARGGSDRRREPSIRPETGHMMRGAPHPVSGH
jgi:hypothetical protein